jgi:hypothetical protein
LAKEAIDMLTFTGWLAERQIQDQQHEAALKSQLAALSSRYDTGAVSPAVYIVIRAIEIEISWLQHNRVRP